MATAARPSGGDRWTLVGSQDVDPLRSPGARNGRHQFRKGGTQPAVWLRGKLGKGMHRHDALYTQSERSFAEEAGASEPLTPEQGPRRARTQGADGGGSYRSGSARDGAGRRGSRGSSRTGQVIPHS